MSTEKTYTFTTEKNIPPINTKPRSSFKFILFSVLTCGVYSLVFTHGVVRDINTISKGYGIKKIPGLLSLIVFTPLTLGLYYFYWLVRLSNRIKTLSVPMIYKGCKCRKSTTLLFWNTVGLMFCGLGPLVGLGYICDDVDLLVAIYNGNAYESWM